jgi:hypothetical protein
MKSYFTKKMLNGANLLCGQKGGCKDSFFLIQRDTIYTFPDKNNQLVIKSDASGSAFKTVLSSVADQ